MQTFGTRLRELRRTRGINQRNFADLVGIDFSYVSKMERGCLEYAPSEHTIRRMAEVLDTSAFELLNLAGKIPSGFKQLFQENAAAGELLRLLGEHRLSDAAYEQMLAIARQAVPPPVD